MGKAVAASERLGTRTRTPSPPNVSTRLRILSRSAEMGLSSVDWENTVELEAFVDQPFAIKEVIEHGSKAGPVAGPVTGAQSLMINGGPHGNVRGRRASHSFTLPADCSAEGSYAEC